MQKRKFGKPLSLGLKKTGSTATQPVKQVNLRGLSYDAAEAQWPDELAAKEASDKKKRNLDTFLEELKQEHEQEAKRLSRRAEAPPENTTNLHINNLPSDVDEQVLCTVFGKFGAIGSVKILWPRGDEPARPHNTGFVCFMERAAAEAALQSLSNAELHGQPLRISWGKPVPLPSKPLYVLGEDEAPTGQPFNARSGVADDVPEVQVARPTNSRTLRLIHWTVEHVIRHGPRFECLLISRVHNDPRFRFLVDWQSADHAYYRWRMYSLLCGDTKDHWRQRMFMMYDAVPVWVPPTVAVHPVAWNLESSESEEHGDTELSSRTRGRLQRRVDRVQNSGRGVIASAMAMAVECAHAPEQVVDIVCQAFANAQTPTAKLAKLHLVSDILHNSAAPVANAWRLRQAFEPRLEEVFDALVLAHRAIDARLRAEQFRKRVLAVLAVWETWVVYPAERIYELAAKFMD
ncbi:hypothetical protein H4S02_000226 [Coemansia sp. RSA 2611]|nr:hypothetical protein H4S02_000226 [Coemansia sp. RSA 2611]